MILFWNLKTCRESWEEEAKHQGSMLSWLLIQYHVCALSLLNLYSSVSFDDYLTMDSGNVLNIQF